MHGIFFDEAPHEYSVDAVSYMQTVNQVVKNSTGLQGAKTVSFPISFLIPGPRAIISYGASQHSAPRPLTISAF